MKTYYLDYPPFSRDFVSILTKEEFFSQELPANHHYERVTIPGDFETEEDMRHHVQEENNYRAS